MHRILNPHIEVNYHSLDRPWLLVAMIICVFILTGCASSAQTAPLATPTLTPDQELGQSLFELHCENCHSTIPDSIVVGPSLAGVANRAGERIQGMGAREYMEKSISDPGDYLVEGYPDLMPATLSETLSEEEVQAVLNFLMTLED